MRTAIQPRGLTKEEAAAYVGCRTLSAFNYRVAQGLLPRAIPGTRTWDRKALDAAMDKASGIKSDGATTELDEWLANAGQSQRAASR